ncbi:MAG: tRNA (guanosine(37)-N1)-methyltransferase TrmD [Arenimonas sp.]|uniref:tRNA (guanosine(37)-N1)-methyltransferase TrmD n=1 Tax=Arenimonas sp. TaxID=1872635 RepID=UPI003C094587
MRFDVITLFPDYFRQCLQVGVVGRAFERGLAGLHVWNPRDFTHDNYRRIDERPFGGGPGMVMMADPLIECLDAVVQADEAPAHTVYLSPQGRPFTQAKARELAARPRLVLLAGRYEGVDQRFLDARIDEEISLGDYVLSGGELPAATVIDAVVRLLDGVLNDAESAVQDSFENGLLDCPHFTRSESLGTAGVPEVLLSGNHALIARWRRKQSLGRTWLKRPDLLDESRLSKADAALLAEFKAEQTGNSPADGQAP